MHWRDLLGLAMSALWQQKVRTLLTLLGVIFGSFVLAASLSIGQGVQDAIASFARQNEALRRVEAMPEWNGTVSTDPAAETQVSGEMSEARRARLQKSINQFQAATRTRDTRTKLTEEMLAKLKEIPHVETVYPMAFLSGFALLGESSHPTLVTAARTKDPKATARLVAGRYFETPDEPSAVVDEFLLYRLGIEDEAAMQNVLGKKLRLEFRPDTREGGIQMYFVRPEGGQATRAETAAIEALKEQLPGVIEQLKLRSDEIMALRKMTTSAPAVHEEEYSEEFTIVGVIRAPTDEESQEWDSFQLNGGVALPYAAAARLFFSVPGKNEEGVERAALVVDHEENVKEVLASVRKLGLRGHALIEFIERERVLYLMIFGGMTCVAAVAMLVAALGIANTMLISVLERTREIGIMKAVGAQSGQLQLIFLVEGALIGAVGGGLGLLLAWAGSFPGDAWVRGMATRDLKVDLKESIFVFPPWLVATVAGAALLVTILAAVYPARRAARLDPVTALRHE